MQQNRLTKPTMTALEYGLPVDALLAGMAAALKYDNAVRSTERRITG